MTLHIEEGRGLGMSEDAAARLVWHEIPALKEPERMSIPRPGDDDYDYDDGHIAHIVRIETGPNPEDTRVFLSDGAELVGVTVVRAHDAPGYVDIAARVAGD